MTDSSTKDDAPLMWYFADESCTLRYGDGRAIVIGETHTVGGELALCSHGLHASARAIDALGFAPGPIVYRVKLHGDILHDADGNKACATARTYMAGGVDVSDELCAFSRWCALQVAHLWDMPPIVRQYLETGDETIRAAAWDAAGAVGTAAWDAARDAAWAAARDAAWAVAWAAARAAAWAAAWDAAWAAARDAAWDAPWDAARAAKIAEFNAELERRLIAKIEAAHE